jgi:general secretion pathway protein G
MKRIQPRQSAYTLTEMLVVLVIIGLLAAVVGPRLFNRLDDAKQRTARLQLTAFETSIDLFRLDVGRLPLAEEGLDVLVRAPQDAPGWLGPYLARDAVPLDPWGRAYVYGLDASGGRYRLASLGSDGREGGAGSAADLVVEGGSVLTPEEETTPADGAAQASDRLISASSNR